MAIATASPRRPHRRSVFGAIGALQLALRFCPAGRVDLDPTPSLGLLNKGLNRHLTGSPRERFDFCPPRGWPGSVSAVCAGAAAGTRRGDGALQLVYVCRASCRYGRCLRLSGGRATRIRRATNAHRPSPDSTSTRYVSVQPPPLFPNCRFPCGLTTTAATSRARLRMHDVDFGRTLEPKNEGVSCSHLINRGAPIHLKGCGGEPSRGRGHADSAWVLPGWPVAVAQ